MNAQGSSNSQSVNEALFVRPAYRRAISLALVVVAGVFVSVAISYLAYHWEAYDELEHQRSQFQLDAQEVVGSILQQIATHVQALRSLGALFEASKQVTREEFQVFASTLMEADQTIQALEWIPRITRLQRSTFEEQARSATPGFRITQRNASGALIAAPLSDEYFPVYFVEPYIGNESALGFDLASETIRREALDRARDSGRITVSGRITLVQETAVQAGVLAYLPIYRKGASLTSQAQRREYLEGFALVVCRVGDLIEHAMARLASKGIDVWVYDTTTPSKPELLHVHADPASLGDTRRPRPVDAFHAKDSFEVGGRRWEVVATPAPGAFVPPVTYLARLMLLAGLLITGMLVWYMRALQRYGLEMAQANCTLDREVAEHRQTAEALKKSDAKLRQILESAADAIVISNEQGQMLTVNRQAERLFGFDRRELTGRRKDGTLVPLEISLTPTSIGEERMVTAIIRDISARKEAEAELRRLNRTQTVLSICNNTLARSVD